MNNEKTLKAQEKHGAILAAHDAFWRAERRRRANHARLFAARARARERDARRTEIL